MYEFIHPKIRLFARIFETCLESISFIAALVLFDIVLKYTNLTLDQVKLIYFHLIFIFFSLTNMCYSFILIVFLLAFVVNFMILIIAFSFIFTSLSICYPFTLLVKPKHSCFQASSEMFSSSFQEVAVVPDYFYLFLDLHKLKLMLTINYHWFSIKLVIYYSVFTLIFVFILSLYVEYFEFDYPSFFIQVLF